MATYYYNIAASPDVEIEDDQPKLKQNTNTIFSSFSVDHVWENQNKEEAGKHRRLTFSPQSSPPDNQTSNAVIWGTAQQVNANLGIGQTYSYVVGQKNLIPKSGDFLWTGLFTTTISGSQQTFALSGRIVVSPLVGSPLFSILVYCNAAYKAFTTPFYIFVPYGFTIPTGIVYAQDAFSVYATTQYNSPSSYTVAQVASQSYSGAYTNGVVFRFSYAYRSSMTVIGY